MNNLISISNLLQKDFYIIITNCESRSNIINANNLYIRKIFLINISTVFLINVLLLSIVYNT